MLSTSFPREIPTMKHLALFITLIHSAFALEKDFFESNVIPSSLEVPIDNSIYIRMKKSIDSQTACDFKAPGKKEINSVDTFVKFSDDKCGIIIERVQKSHAGAWQLISSFKNATYETSVKGLVIVNVRESAVIVKQDRDFSHMENFAPTGVDLSYCFVSRNLGYTKMSGIDKTKCMIPQHLSEDFRDGSWNVRVGIVGDPKEVFYSVNIQSTDETIETEVTRLDNENINLLCRVKNLKNVLKFCRFERADAFGLNLREGIAFESYRYFGQGLDHGECGLKISKITAVDKTQWKCFLGLVDAVDAANTKIPEESKSVYKISAVLDASDDWNKLKILSTDTELFFVDNRSAIIQCNANTPFDYCYFLHPIHKILSVSDRKIRSEDDDFQYYGEGFHLAQCGVKIRSFYFSDAGEWKCGVGRASESMKEAVKTMKVVVTASFMMAITKQIEDFNRNSIVLQCRAIPVGSSLASCHFLTPTGEAFSINERVTQTEAIDGLYYFDPNRKLIDGYCTVVIKSLNKDLHAGKWTCSGRILGHDEESYDTIYVTVDGLRGASFSYISIAITVPLLLIVALSAYGFRWWKQRQQVQNEALDEISMHTIGSTGTASTTSSEDSRAATSHSA